MANDDWIEFTGENKPDPDALVLVLMRDGNATHIPHPAGEIHFGRDETSGDARVKAMRRKFEVTHFKLA